MVVSGELPRLCQRSPHLGWQIQVLDAQGSDVLLHKAFASAIASHSNGIILGGFEASELTEEVAAAQRAHIVLVGWHAASRPGVVPGLFFNVSTDPQKWPAVPPTMSSSKARARLALSFSMMNASTLPIARPATCRS
jgi:hypothetical protein